MKERQKSDEIVGSLAGRQWRLELVNICDIQLNPLIMESCDIKTGQRFRDRLKERTSELLRALDRDGVAIWPLVIVDDRHLLIDGYCRYSALASIGVSKAYGYSGHIIAAKGSRSLFGE